jgi:phytoene synthase
MQDNFTHCANLVRAADRDRYLATLFAPAEHRAALHALYAFNLEVARVRELAREPMPGEVRLQWWREVLAGERDGEAAAHPVASALRETMERHALDPAPLLTLVDGHTFDLYDEPMASLDDLDRYAADTRSTLLTAAAVVLGVEPVCLAPVARPAGIAATVASVLGGFARHSAHGQLFIPLEVLERNNVDRAAIFAGETGEGLRAAFAELIRHARRQLAAAQAAVADIPAAALPALLPLATVRLALRRMEKRGFDPFRPDPPPVWRRQWLIWRAARHPRRIFLAQAYPALDGFYSLG